MLTTAIVTAKVDGGGPLEASLRRTGLVASVKHWSADRSPSARASVPDVVLLDLSRSAEACLRLAARLRELQPKVYLIGWSSGARPTADLLLEAMRTGLQDFLPAPIDTVKLKEVLGRATHLEQEAIREPRLTMVMGAKGGAGATTVVVNLAVQLAQVTQKRVTLLDLACPLGHVSLFLDLQPRFSVRDAVENLERLDEHMFNGLLTEHKSGVAVLAGSTRPDDWRDLAPAALARVINIAQNNCDFVLVDFSAPYAPALSSVLKQAHALVLVAGVDAANLSNLERQVSALTTRGIDPERLRIVINRWHTRDEAMLNRFLEKTNCSVLARLPNDFPQVNQAITLGVPLSKNHSGPLPIQFRELAAQLAGVAAGPEESDARGGLLYMLRASTARIGVPLHRISIARTT